MYENGRKVNGYRRKRIHKRKMKKRYAIKHFYYGPPETWNRMVIRYINEERRKDGYHPLDYWRDYYLSGPRGYAKRQTRRAVRNYWKQVIANADEGYESVPTIRGNGYRRQYDYAWTVW